MIKLLTIFLLLSYSLFGQINSSNKIFYPDATITIVDSNKTTVLPYIDMLKEYKKYCFNDSVAVYYYTVCDNGCVDILCNKGEKNLLGMECPEHWIHREETFSDFIKWVIKNYDEN
jgi:hypothetical protein